MTMIYNFLKKRYIQHSIAWTLYIWFSLNIYPLKENQSLISAIPQFLVSLSALMATIYLHFYFLKYITQRRYLLYFFSAIAIICIFSIIDLTMNPILNNWTIENYMTEVLSLTFAIFITTFLKYIKKGIVSLYQLRELKTKQAETEYSLLKAQVNPHFLFNTLNNMYALSLKKSDHLSDMLLELSDLMRYQLESSKKAIVNLEDEISYLENFVNLERIRVQKFCNIEFNVSGLLDGKKIAPLLFIPLIENAFKYGISASKENFINITFKVSEAKVYFFIENSIAKINKHQSSTGTGIENVKKRLNILYPNKHLLNLHEENHVFSVKMNIDFN